MDEYLKMIDWDWLCSNTLWGFIHGDFQFENIIYDPKSDKFTCIDWRTDFGGDSYGDLYYDLGKMLGGILLDYQAVKSDKLEYSEKNEVAVLNDCSIPNADVYIDQLKTFCETKGLDWNKVFLLVPLIYLNMSPLHESPFDKYLFALSQLYFSKVFNESK
jgi:aminoglycoside phosphotransferase (APT) family kinase protein